MHRRRSSRVLTVALVLAVLAVLAVVAAVAAGTADAVRGPTARERSLAATERPCGRRYVERRPFRPPAPPARTAPVAVATEPVALAVDPRGAAPTLLAERPGRVLALGDDGRPTGEVVLDLSGDTIDRGDGGLLALAYDPDGGWLLVYRTTAGKDDVVTAYPLDASGRPDPAGEVEVLRSGHPGSEQHHGGGFAFAPDGTLFIGFGDGGGLGDPHGNAQNPGTLLGKLLRIDPTPGAAEPYAVPADNPFVGRSGWRPEIWALGVRNPYRLSFDAATGDLWLGDVGQSCWDEIDVLAPDDAGGNLGWDHREGIAPFEGGRVPGRAVWPVHTTAHRDGWCAIVGGYVVRNPALGDLDGWYLFADYCAGAVHALRPGGPGRPWQLLDTRLRVERPVALVEGPDGHPWVLSLDGAVHRIEPRPAAAALSR